MTWNKAPKMYNLNFYKVNIIRIEKRKRKETPPHKIIIIIIIIIIHHVRFFFFFFFKWEIYSIGYVQLWNDISVDFWCWESWEYQNNEASQMGHVPP